MIFLKHYLDFSYKYRLLVGDKLNGDIKYLIWKIYRRMVAREYLTKKMFYLTNRCEECYFARLNILDGPNRNFYIVPACNNPNAEASGVLCCYKQICAGDCKFKLYCDKCSIKTDYTPLRYPFENDNGNNIIENREDIRVPCRNCGDIITKKMYFNDYYLEECG